MLSCSERNKREESYTVVEEESTNIPTVVENADFVGRFIEVCGSSEPADVQRKLGISYQGAKNYLLGRLPAPDVLQQIAERTNFSVHWLLTGKGPKLVNAASYADVNFELDDLWNRIEEAAKTTDLAKISKIIGEPEKVLSRWKAKETFPTAARLLHTSLELKCSLYWLMTGQGSKTDESKELRKRVNDLAFTAEYSLRINRKVGTIIDIPTLPSSLMRERDNVFINLGLSVDRYVNQVIDKRLGIVNPLDALLLTPEDAGEESEEGRLQEVVDVDANLQDETPAQRAKRLAQVSNNTNEQGAGNENKRRKRRKRQPD